MLVYCDLGVQVLSRASFFVPHALSQVNVQGPLRSAYQALVFGKSRCLLCLILAVLGNLAPDDTLHSVI